MAGAVGLREVRVRDGGSLDADEDASIPLFLRPASASSVRAACGLHEVQGTFALTIDGRGFDASVRPGG